MFPASESGLRLPGFVYVFGLVHAEGYGQCVLLQVHRPCSSYTFVDRTDIAIAVCERGSIAQTRNGILRYIATYIRIYHQL
jgi:hypothetical protein